MMVDLWEYSIRGIEFLTYSSLDIGWHSSVTSARRLKTFLCTRGGDYNTGNASEWYG